MLVKKFEIKLSWKLIFSKWQLKKLQNISNVLDFSIHTYSTNYNIISILGGHN